MKDQISVDGDLIEKAITLITEVMAEHEIPKLEGACAMSALLESLKSEGVHLLTQRKLQS